MESLQVYNHNIGYLNTKSDLYDLEKQLYYSAAKNIFIQFYFDAYYNEEGFDDRELFLNDYKQYILLNLDGRPRKISQMQIYDNNIFVLINRFWFYDKRYGPSRFLIEMFILKWKKKYPEYKIAHIVLPMRTATTIIRDDGRVEVKFKPPFEYPPDLIVSIWRSGKIIIN